MGRLPVAATDDAAAGPVVRDHRLVTYPASSG